MNRIDDYIEIYLTTKDQRSKEIAFNDLKSFYDKHINAHIEYLDKDIYKDVPELADFRRRINEITKILKSCE